MANDDSAHDSNPSVDDAAKPGKEVARTDGTAEGQSVEIGTLIRKELAKLELAPVVPLGTRLMAISAYELEKIYWVAGILFFVVLILKALRS